MRRIAVLVLSLILVAVSLSGDVPTVEVFSEPDDGPVAVWGSCPSGSCQERHG